MNNEELINSIQIDKANLEYIANTGKINGTLLNELERVLTQQKEANKEFAKKCWMAGFGYGNFHDEPDFDEWYNQNKDNDNG